MISRSLQRSCISQKAKKKYCSALQQEFAHELLTNCLSNQVLQCLIKKISHKKGWCPMLR